MSGVDNISEGRGPDSGGRGGCIHPNHLLNVVPGLLQALITRVSLHRLLQLVLRFGVQLRGGNDSSVSHGDPEGWLMI